MHATVEFMTSNFDWQLSWLDESQIPAAVDLDLKTLGGKWSADGYRQEVARENSICLGLNSRGQTEQLIGMGFVWCIQDEAHIIMIAIDPESQKRGFGGLMLSHMIDQARQRGCVRATLEVSINNIGAISLYRKFGFEELGQRPNYYGKGDHALILWLNQLKQPAWDRSKSLASKVDCSGLI